MAHFASPSLRVVRITVPKFVANTVLVTPFAAKGASVAATALAGSAQTLVASGVMIAGTLLVPPTLFFLFHVESAPGPGASAPPDARPAALHP